MPKLGGALIGSVEKPFPEWEAGRMDPIGWERCLSYCPPHSLFCWAIFIISHGLSLLIGAQGCGRGKEMMMLSLQDFGKSCRVKVWL